MSEEGGKQPIIIKKINKVAGGHHGGAWKVAYADFVTAMMAFFLLLWLLNVTTDEQKNGIADYFSPNVVSSSNSGGGGVLGGQVINDTTANRSSMSPSMIPLELPPAGVNPEGQVDERSPEDGGITQPNEIKEKNNPSQFDQKEKSNIREETILKETEQEIRQIISTDPQLASLSENVLLDMTQEGLRIQLVDSDKYGMFEPGTARMLPKTRQLIAKITEVIRKVPNKISISGHTDSYTFATGPGYTTWELSADRANASRRAMLEKGLSESRINRVIGKADKELLNQDPYSPANRRISVVLLRSHMIDGFSFLENKVDDTTTDVKVK